MQYLGGKAIISKRWSHIIRPVSEGRTPWEPFCGGLGASVNLECKKHILSDIHRPLITMWDHVLLRDWSPNPGDVTRDVFNRYKSTRPDDDPMTAYIGFGCTFCGAYFAGYVDYHFTDSYHQNVNSRWSSFPMTAANSILKTRWLMRDKGIEIFCDSFLTCDLPDGVDVVYCDPPYEGTEGYKGTSVIDHEAFWNRCRELSDMGAHVFVSERVCPEDFDVVWRGGKKVTAGLKKTGGRTGQVMEEVLCYRGPGLAGRGSGQLELDPNRRGYDV